MPDSPRRPRKLLALCDSPTVNTGFSRVVNNLFPKWIEDGFFEEIWIFAIGYRGYPHDLPYRLIPAATVSSPKIWWETENLQRFLNQAQRQDVGYTHVWMMHDTFSLLPLADPLREIAKARRDPEKAGLTLPRTFLYAPIDGRMRRDWLRIIEATDHPVVYTEAGKRECLRAFEEGLRSSGVKGGQLKGAVDGLRARIRTLAHGTDTDTYYPLSEERRLRAREERFGGLVGPDDFLIANVNAHQKRKGIFQTLETFARLRALDTRQRDGKPLADRYRLYLHMPRRNQQEGTDLLEQARALGIPEDTVIFGDNYFIGGYAAQPESTVNEIYNAADLIISTTHGEGWGLTITEAMAAGRPVAAPRHTAMEDYFDGTVGIELPAPHQTVILADNNIVRPVVDPDLAANAILDAIETDQLDRLGAAARERMQQPCYDWTNIARQWLQWFAEDV